MARFLFRIVESHRRLKEAASLFKSFCKGGNADCDKIETSQEAEYGQEEKQRTE